MEGQKREMLYSEEEVDLYELCLVLKKRLGLIAGLFVTAVAAAVAVSLLLPPVYRGTFTVRVPMVSEMQTGNVFNEGGARRVPLISPKEAVKLIANLDRLREEEQLGRLSDMLGISSEKAASLVELTAHVPRDVRDFVEVVMDVRSPSVIVDFKEAILRYLNGNRYVRERISLRRASLLSLREEIEGEMAEVEAMKRLVGDQIRRDGKRELGFNPIEMDREVIVFKQMLRHVETEIKLLRGFETVVEPVVSDRPVRPKKVLYAAIAGVSSIFFGVLAAFFMEWLDRNRRGRRE